MPECGTSTSSMTVSRQTDFKTTVVPNNSLADVKSGESRFMQSVSLQKKPMKKTKAPPKSSMGKQIASCNYCDNVFVNLHYLENYLRVSSAKTPCNCCATCLSFLIFMKQQYPRPSERMAPPFLAPYYNAHYAMSYAPAQSMRNLYPRKAQKNQKHYSARTAQMVPRKKAVSRNTSLMSKSASAKGSIVSGIPVRKSLPPSSVVGKSKIISPSGLLDKKAIKTTYLSPVTEARHERNSGATTESSMKPILRNKSASYKKDSSNLASKPKIRIVKSADGYRQGSKRKLKKT